MMKGGRCYNKKDTGLRKKIQAQYKQDTSTIQGKKGLSKKREPIGSLSVLDMTYASI
jgi:hypothetical protein